MQTIAGVFLAASSLRVLVWIILDSAQDKHSPSALTYLGYFIGAVIIAIKNNIPKNNTEIPMTWGKQELLLLLSKNSKHYKDQFFLSTVVARFKYSLVASLCIFFALICFSLITNLPQWKEQTRNYNQWIAMGKAGICEKIFLDANSKLNEMQACHFMAQFNAFNKSLAECQMLNKSLQTETVKFIKESGCPQSRVNNVYDRIIGEMNKEEIVKSLGGNSSAEYERILKLEIAKRYNTTQENVNLYDRGFYEHVAQDVVNEYLRNIPRVDLPTYSPPLTPGSLWAYTDLGNPFDLLKSILVLAAGIFSISVLGRSFIEIGHVGWQRVVVVVSVGIGVCFAMYAYLEEGERWDVVINQTFAAVVGVSAALIYGRVVWKWVKEGFR